MIVCLYGCVRVCVPLSSYSDDIRVIDLEYGGMNYVVGAVMVCSVCGGV